MESAIVAQGLMHNKGIVRIAYNLRLPATVQARRSPPFFSTRNPRFSNMVPIKLL